MRIPTIARRIVSALTLTVLSAVLLLVVSSVWAFCIQIPENITSAELIAAVYSGFIIVLISPWSWLFLPYQFIILSLGLNVRFLVLHVPIAGALIIAFYLFTLGGPTAEGLLIQVSVLIASIVFVFLNALILRPRVLEPLEYEERYD